MARELLARMKIETVETVDARKVKFDRAAAIALARKMSVVFATRGPAVVRFDMRKSPPDDDSLAKAIVGPTGNLKAPALRIGEHLFVGLTEATVTEFPPQSPATSRPARPPK